MCVIFGWSPQHPVREPGAGGGAEAGAEIKKSGKNDIEGEEGGECKEKHAHVRFLQTRYERNVVLNRVTRYL